MKKIMIFVTMLVMSLGIGGVVVSADEIETTQVEETTEFDYSKMPKQYRYSEDWGLYYDLHYSSITIKNQKFNGKESTPTPKILVHNVKNSKVDTLLDKKYFKITYKNNDKPGKATATIEGINGFYGKKTLTFKIKIKSPKIKYVGANSKKITIKIVKNSIKGIKYEIRYKKNTRKLTSKHLVYVAGKGIKPRYTTGKWKYKTSKSKLIKTKNLKKGNYFIQVRSYVTINNKNYYSNWKVYNSLVNVKVKNNAKKSKKIVGYKGVKTPEKIIKIWNNKKFGRGSYYFRSFEAGKINGVKATGWHVYYNNSSRYLLYADKNGNVIY